MNKVYSRINWKNYPSTDTALNENNLNRMDKALDDLDNRVIEQDSTKAPVVTVNNMVKDWTIDEETGVITVAKQNGSKIMFDLNIEKIPVSFELSDSGILTMTTDDGTKFTANIGAMIPVLTFTDSDQIAVSVSGSGVNKTYSFGIKNGSITEDKLNPDYLASIKSSVSKAQSSEKNASDYATASENSSVISKSYAMGGTNTREEEETTNAKYYAELAGTVTANAEQYLSDIENAGNNQIAKINDALSSSIPTFNVDLATGELEYTGGKFEFSVNQSTGDLEYELSV